MRLRGIDSPELRGNTEEERQMAHKAQQALSSKIMGKDVFLKNIAKEKYGRILCDIYLQRENISDWMLKNRYAVPYEGGKKKVPTSWKAYHENNVI